MPTGGDGDHSGGIDKEAAIAKTAGFVVFSGIAMSLLKTLNPFDKNKDNTTATVDSCSTKSFNGSIMPLQESISPPLQELIKPVITQERPASSARTVEIVKGDTLWGLSRKYGVSIDAIKEANGLTGDTIYAGKKLVIP
ncbi:probable N-acetylmuramidase [Macadamia integrifolia]|uniref:probable N-acetylmuramidase n=1 Tax=Macadamia integrifolia TaxID=60698 RepID=UPI001C4E36A7|nr:probable N-acetylmuramidase [Macadamia integrifolia]